MPEFIKIENRDRVRLVTLSRPEKKNAISDPMWLDIAAAFRAADADENARCLVLTGADGNFSAGIDLASFMAGDAAENKAFAECARAVTEFSKPWLGAAAGFAIGGGATILFHADILYVGESLRMRLPFAALGLVPEFASSYRLQANIGAQRAAELFYTAEWIDAARAVECGIAARSFPDAELLNQAMQKAAEIAQWPARVLQEVKTTLAQPHRAAMAAAFDCEAEGMKRLIGSPENLEAVKAFFAQREKKG